MFSFVCFLLYAAPSLQFVCSLYVCMLCLYCAHAAYVYHVCGANPQKGVRTIDRVRVNGW